MAEPLGGATVRLTDLIKRFDSVLAVDQVTLDISPGEFITLLGPSGSGKTTTLMMIAGFQIPDRGEIHVDDEPVMFTPAYKRGIGMVFQNYSLFPHMTVRRNITFPLRMRRVPKAERSERVKWALELVKLPGYESRYPRQLSGGQQQRVALARALVFNPRLLLMDEPLGALDKKLREHMQFEIKQITRSLNITTIYVTHDQGEAMTMSDRIAVMNEGRLVQVGSPKEIYDHPADLFVADFIGESNFVPGRVAGIDDDAGRFVSRGGGEYLVDPACRRKPGEEGNLVIRPEKVSFVRSGETFCNRFEAVVDEVFYLGDTLLFKVTLTADETRLTVKQQNKHRPDAIARGDRVTVGWNRQDAGVV